MSADDPGDGGVVEVSTSNLRYHSDTGRFTFELGADDATFVVDQRGTRVVRGSASVATHHNRVERSVDDGLTWELVADLVPLNGSVTDPECLSAGRTTYRVTAVSETPSEVRTEAGLETSSGALWLSGGGGFATVVALEWDPKHGLAPGLVDRVVIHPAGRLLGVEMSGTARAKKVPVSATLLDESWETIQRIEALAYLPGPFLYRSPMGERVYCSMAAPSLDRDISGKWTFSTTLEEVGRE
jgi:hypothetical protein